MASDNDRRVRRRLEILTDLGLLRSLRELQGNPRIHRLIIAHIGDGVQTVECWVSLEEPLRMRTVDVDGEIQAAPDGAVLIEDPPMMGENVPDEDALSTIFHLSPEHLWVGVDE